MNNIDKILGIASDFGCDVEGFRPHLEQILRELKLKNPPSRNKVGAANDIIAESNIDTLEEILDKIYEYGRSMAIREKTDGTFEPFNLAIAKQALNLYIKGRERLARIDELKLIQQCGKDHDLAGAVKWLVEDRIKELEK